MWFGRLYAYEMEVHDHGSRSEDAPRGRGIGRALARWSRRKLRGDKLHIHTVHIHTVLVEPVLVDTVDLAGIVGFDRATVPGELPEHVGRPARLTRA